MFNTKTRNNWNSYLKPISVTILTIRLFALDFWGDSWFGLRPHQLSPIRNLELMIILLIRELKQITTAAATGTSLNKKFIEQNKWLYICVISLYLFALFFKLTTIWDYQIPLMCYQIFISLPFSVKLTKTWNDQIPLSLVNAWARKAYLLKIFFEINAALRIQVRDSSELTSAMLTLLVVCFW